jgi:site-specific recombinase XerD
MSLAVVADLRSRCSAPTAEDVEALETDLLSGFVLARASAGFTDATIVGDVRALGSVREWLGKPLWEMEPSDCDRYLGQRLRKAAKQTKTAVAGSISLFFRYLEQRHGAEIYHLTGWRVECPVDELNRPRGGQETMIRIPPPESVLQALFGAWRTDLEETRKFVTEARDFTACRLMAKVGLRINETAKLDVDDIREVPEQARLPKLNVRFGKGAYGSGPKLRVVPLLNGADALLEWYVQQVRPECDGERFWSRPGAPLFCSERRNGDGSAKRVAASSLRTGLTDAVARYAPAEWQGKITPHVLRHYCASELYRTGMDLVAVQELLGHQWVATTMRYVHVQRNHVENSWLQASARTARRLQGAPS